ncbi:MAG: ESX-1 secretion-associated protein, partial [Mycobacteriaceae bacterium]|nr:ESX-1 secretion-associated protein [Mycobacteriaceae bacterium]
TLVMAFKRAVEISCASVIACIGLLGDCLDHSRRRADRATRIDYKQATLVAQQPKTDYGLAPASRMPQRLFGPQHPPCPAALGHQDGRLAFDPDELHQLANRHHQAADQTGSILIQTAHQFGHNLQDTHGAISGPSNNAFATKARQREKARRAMHIASLTFAATLRSAAVSYSQTDVSAATKLA